jgi:hypothetical protein
VRELRLLELLIFFLISVPALRPAIKGLFPFSGLVWLQLIALGIVASLFPAYGFRVECVPLVVFTAFLNIATFIDNGGRIEGFRKPKIPPAICILLAVVSTGGALYFSPLLDTALNADAETLLLFDEERRIDFSLRVYGDRTLERPLMLVVPPRGGSSGAVDRICTEIERQGFTVVTFEKKALRLGERITLLRAMWEGTVSEKANQWGRAFEDERRSDIVFMLGYLEQVFPAPVPIFLLGYDAGASAAILLASETSFSPHVKGIIAVESRLWSLYQREVKQRVIPEDATLLQKLRLGIAIWFEKLKPKRVDSLVLALPELKVPALFLVADRLTKPRQRDGPYLALLQTLYKAAAPVTLLALDGAGTLDYSDYPLTQPLYSDLNRGMEKRVLERGAYLASTVTLIRDFADSALDGGAFGDKVTAYREISHIETNGAWN